jgi:hypothetical protein
MRELRVLALLLVISLPCFPASDRQGTPATLPLLYGHALRSLHWDRSTAATGPQASSINDVSLLHPCIVDVGAA